MKSLLEIIKCVAENPSLTCALATLVRTTGSTYRKPGARMLIDTKGNTTGVLSGGCLEEEIARRGMEVIASGDPVLISFDTRRLYGCDGKVEIFVERIPPAGTVGNLLTNLGDALEKRCFCRVLTRFEGEAQGSELLPGEALVSESEGSLIHPVPLPVRALVFGTGPEVGPFLYFCAGLGWRVDCFSHPSELAEDFLPDAQTSAVVMMHNFGRDLAAIDRLLPLQLPYVGLLGPRKRQAEIIARLRDYREFDPSWLEPLHAPAGLDIGSEAPEEIALSIVSEISAVLAGRDSGFLRDRQESIHTRASLGIVAA